jgi:triacylglycerol lipase
MWSDTMKSLLAVALLGSLSLAACVAPVEGGGGTQPGAQDPDDPSGGSNGAVPHGGFGTGNVGFVLAHGLAGDRNSFDPKIIEALKAAGYSVVATEVPGVDSVANRAAALGPQIDAFVTTNQIDHLHVIAHSMGGLDARYLISTLGYASKVKSLTTLSTPHRGSPIADAALGLTDALPEKAVEALADALGFDATDDQLQAALTDLSEAQSTAFNTANPDSPNVKYFSYAGYSTILGATNPNASSAELCGAAGPDPGSLPADLTVTGGFIASGQGAAQDDEALRPHDGVVPIESSKWTGFQGCIPTDHLDMTRAGDKDEADLDLDLVKLYTDIATLVTTP